jgi:hypothetical protein
LFIADGQNAPIQLANCQISVLFLFYTATGFSRFCMDEAKDALFQILTATLPILGGESSMLQPQIYQSSFPSSPITSSGAESFFSMHGKSRKWQPGRLYTV